ncbi:hypothetical protein [Geminocystis sp. NIES-3709]|uniref:hypothetical protein n=1 Tax=Geminocystis sp. NIES-3709 TaxID=1617448 RepID=UPI0005FC58BA|nr:hypothetical protein [Geminocystis sp. NIES-3709]BAQ65150.1 hypothetical protein GM3709_1915 [Geminocystis sp. NIES-3709]
MSISNPSVFFAEFTRKSEEAIDISGNPVEYFYRIGNLTVKLRFAGNTLIPYLTKALEHLRIRISNNPDLTILLWDSKSTGVKMPSPPWSIDDYGQDGLIQGFNNHRFCTIFRRTSIGLSMLDKENGIGIYWVKDPNTIPYWEIGAPLREIFYFWFSQYKIQLCHGGAVGKPNGGVLLVGKGGSGKSTTALACLHSELFYASDDYCLVQLEPIPRVLSLYSTGKKNVDDLDRLPFLKNISSNTDHFEGEKALYFIYEYFPQKILSSFPLKTVLIPRITGKIDTNIEEASSIAGLKALAPSSIFQLPGDKRQSLKLMGNLLRQIPCFYLNLGTDIKQISEVISQLIL